jgi:putative Ig domain-containing protein/PKD domain-containing protein
MQRRTLVAAMAAFALVACGRDANITGPAAKARPSIVNAIGVDSTTGATIATNQDDYVPGEFVHLVGSGWTPNETVHLFMTEDPDTHPDVSQDVVADSTGAFSIHFYDVQQYDLGVTFTLTATGLTSGSKAVAVFTDAASLNIFGSDNTQHGNIGSEENLGSIALGTSLVLTCPRGTGITIKGGGLGASTTQAWSIAYGGTGADNSTLLALTTLAPNSGSLTGSSDVDCVAMTITTTTLTAGTTYHGSLQASGASATTGSYFFRFTATVSNTAPILTGIGNKSVNEGSPLTFTATATDTDTPAQTLTFSLVGAPAGATINSSTGAFSWTPTDGPSQTATFTVKMTDNGSPPLSDDEQITVTVNNVPPTATFNAPTSVPGGTNIDLSLTSPSDASSVDAAAGFQYAFDCGTGSGYAAYSATSAASCPTSGTGSRTVKGKIKDKDNGETEYTASVAINNVPPLANAGGPYSGNEGSAINISGSGSDPDGGNVTYLWSVTAGAPCTFGNATLPSTTVTCADNGSWTLTLKVTDDESAFTESTAALSVANVAPTIGSHTLGGNVNEGLDIAFSVSSVTDPSSADQAAGFTYAFACDGVTFGNFGVSNTVLCPAGDGPGSVTIAGEAKDKDGGISTSVSSTFTILNVAPTATFNAPSSVNEGSAINLSLTNPSDPSAADVAAGLKYAFDCGNGSGYDALSASSTKSCSTDDNGTRNVKGKIQDKDGGFTEYTATVTVNNVPPTATFNAPASVNEGSAINLSLTNPVDPSSADVTAGFTYAFDCGDGSGYSAYDGTNTASCPTNDNGSRTVKGKIRDKDGGETPYSAVVSILNVPPSITGVTANPIVAGNIYSVDQNVTITADFTDPGSLDTHTCVATAAGLSGATATGSTANGSPGNGNCSSVIDFSVADVYTVTITVTDKDGGSDSKTLQVVIYDPSAGFVTGGGWINAAAGSYTPDPSLSGKGTFGFVSKYLKGATVPTGNTQFVFHAASFDFHSTSYQFLVVNQNGTNAQFKGDGLVSGSSTAYTFMLWATDGSPDQFRIKIWETANTANVIFDNLYGQSDSATPQAIAGGSIQIQAKK